MSNIDNELVRIINSGRCFLLIGSGLSCDAGLPSWKMLSSDVFEKYKDRMQEIQQQRIINKINTNQFPRVFDDCQKQATSNESFIETVGQIFKSYNHRKTDLYTMISQWPIQTYLTTNYDDILQEELDKFGQVFITKGNTPEAFSTLSSTTEGVIYKIHGDFNDFNNIVLTQTQYDSFQNSPERAYWRDTIFSTISMIPIVIIGYSAKDPDFAEQLERAKRILNPVRPVYMFAADMTEHEIIEYREKFNIKIYGYKTHDGNHNELRRLIKTYDSFIRKRITIQAELFGENNIVDSETASSLFLFNSFRLNKDYENSYLKALEFIVLNELNSVSKLDHQQLDVRVSAKLNSIATIDILAMGKVKENLYGSGMIKITTSDVEITSVGKQLLTGIRTTRKLQEDKFEKWCDIITKDNYPGVLKYSDLHRCINNGLAEAFEKRGIEIAKSIALDDIIEVLGNS